jgi:hypothetical protein
LQPSTLLETVPSQFRLSFNIEHIDELFPDFVLGDFAVLYGSSTVLPLSMLLCVRAQLPYQLGGLETNVVFVDGGNTFQLYDVSYIAQLHKLDTKEVLERIFISRVFTAYQMTSLVLDKLEAAVKTYDAQLVMISDIAGLYLDKDVPTREARNVFNRVTRHLAKFAEENRVIVVATYPPHHPSQRNIFFNAVVCGRANIVASVRPSQHGQQFVLEKHPFFPLGCAGVPSDDLSLIRFMEV